jgi:hypothetical protein
LGEKEVCNEAIDVAGEILLRSFDRSLRLMRCGMRSLNDRHGTVGSWTLLNCDFCRSFHEGADIVGFIMVIMMRKKKTLKKS